jgi:hypothetical protein
LDPGISMSWMSALELAPFYSNPCNRASGSFPQTHFKAQDLERSGGGGEGGGFCCGIKPGQSEGSGCTMVFMSRVFI